MAYNHNEIDKKWHDAWEKDSSFKVEIDPLKPKYYVLDMFPYPSGAGLHVGHLASYTPTDIVARYKRAKSFNVLHPMGYDAFGLPAEQYAIKTGIHPASTTQKAIENFRRQLKSFGYSFDWSREISTCDPNFYKWTQFIFLKLFEKGLAYQKEVPVNWCPALKTVLANEEVIEGFSERGHHPVIRVPMKQWMLKITAYAERLLQDLDKLDWPERTKEGQRNWIGKSTGASINFSIENTKDKLKVFTTRPDTLFGVTFMVIAPEHPLLEKLTTTEQKKTVDKYCKSAVSKSEVDRKAGETKTGVFSGSFALNPVNQTKIPIWVADYVLMDYGTGAIMAVPGHDKRDFNFAKTYDLKILRVVESKEELPFEGKGQLVNSGFLNGLDKIQATKQIIDYLEENKIGRRQINYKLRDWLFSRQRYWGEPFPIIEYPDGTVEGISTDELPVLLPEVADYEPSKEGEPPLARIEDFVHYQKNGKKGRRCTDTMPGSAGSSWYFLRYTDPHNNSAPFSLEAQKYWMPVDLYIGGPEHTVGHLLYARFWQKVLFDAGLTGSDEPFQKLAHQGDILGPDGRRMSKSRGNVVNPDDVREKFGSDACRVYICFMGPFDKAKPWSNQGIEGVRRFLDRLWRLCVNDKGQLIVEDSEPSYELARLMHKTIKKVEEDIESMNFNTAISAMMILVNKMYKENSRPISVLLNLVQILMPFAPHISEELWQLLGQKGYVSLAPWPEYLPEMCQDELVTIGVQVNGKIKGTVQVSPEWKEEKAVEAAKLLTPIAKAIDGKTLVKVIYRAGRILNLIIK